MRKKNAKTIAWIAVALAAVVGSVAGVWMFFPFSPVPSEKTNVRVFWFVPDGVRADPDVFTVYKWAQDGHLPNLKKMMDEGSYGYSIPVFPSHAAVGFATLFTGETPAVHGIADGPMRPPGSPFRHVSQNGFNASVRKAPAIWQTLEKQDILSTLITVPGSTPPEITRGNIVKGYSSSWGVEFPSVVFQSSDDRLIKKIGYNDRAIGKRLTVFGEAQNPGPWQEPEKSYSPAREILFKQWNLALYGLIVDSTDNRKTDYDCIVFSLDRKAVFARVCVGEWSEWHDVTLTSLHGPETPASWLESSVKIKVLRLGAKDFFRIRILYDGLNESLVLPEALWSEIKKDVGPMVDFADGVPAQLVHFDEDKKTFLEEMNFSFDWHQKILNFFWNTKKQDMIIHSVASPNRMLTSRWWMGLFDPQSVSYKKATDAERSEAFEDVLSMYKRIDALLGEAIKNKSPDSYVVFSSSTGAAPVNSAVYLNHFFRKRGWLHQSYDSGEKKFSVDWDKTRVVFLNNGHIYVHHRGMGGMIAPQTGEDYKQLRYLVKAALKSIKAPDGKSPFQDILMREEAVEKFSLPGDVIGDLVVVGRPGYLFVEDITASGQVFEKHFAGGYQHGLDPLENKSVWTPFAVVGPGIKKNHSIEEPLHHADQYRFVMDIMGAPVKSFEGRDVRREITEK